VTRDELIARTRQLINEGDRLIADPSLGALRVDEVRALDVHMRHRVRKALDEREGQSEERCFRRALLRRHPQRGRTRCPGQKRILQVEGARFRNRHDFERAKLRRIDGQRVRALEAGAGTPAGAQEGDGIRDANVLEASGLSHARVDAVAPPGDVLVAEEKAGTARADDRRMVIVVLHGRPPRARLFDRENELALAQPRKRLDARLDSFDHTGIAQRRHALLEIDQVNRRGGIGNEKAGEPLGAPHVRRRGEAHAFERAFDRLESRDAIRARLCAKDDPRGDEPAVGVELREPARDIAKVSRAERLAFVWSNNGANGFGRERADAFDTNLADTDLALELELEGGRRRRTGQAGRLREGAASARGQEQR